MPTPAPITETTVESGTFAAFAAWLAVFFDGGNHTIGFGPSKTFPTADVRFQEGAHPQPLPGLGIRMTWIKSGKAMLKWESVGGVRQHMAKQPATWMFWVRSAANKREDAQKAAQDAAQLLFAILQNTGATKLLSQSGIHRLRSEQPQMGGDAQGVKPAEPFYCLRFLQVSGTLRYPVISQDPSIF